MSFKFKKLVKYSISLLEVLLAYMFIGNIFSFFSLKKETVILAKFVVENLFLVYIFIYNIRTIISLKSENEKITNTMVLKSALLNVIYFMNVLVLYNYIEVYVFYFIAVVYLLYVIFKFGLVGEKYTIYNVDIKHVAKYIIVAVLVLALVGEGIFFVQVKGQFEKIIAENTNMQTTANLTRLFAKEKLEMIIKGVIFVITSVFLLLGRKNKINYLINSVLALVTLMCSVFSIPNSMVYYLVEIVISNHLIASCLEYKKKPEIN